MNTQFVITEKAAIEYATSSSNSKNWSIYTLRTNSAIDADFRGFLPQPCALSAEQSRWTH